MASTAEEEDAELTVDDVFNTIRYFASRTPGRDDPEMLQMQKKCLELFVRDTPCTVIPNLDGSLCAHYPPGIIVPQGSTGQPTSADTTDLHGMFFDARFARTRSRFVCPVILHRGKWICRSATLARQVEVTARQAGVSLSELYSGSLLAGRRPSSSPSTPQPEADKFDGEPKFDSGPTLDSVDTARNNDIVLLRSLGVQYICDLMVEDRKVKYGIQLTSSEKVDKHSRYTKGFDLVTIPYPGCELFTKFRDRQYCGSSVRYNWDGGEVNASLQLPTEHTRALGINWAEDYRNWDLILLTQNYMLLLLELLRSGDSERGGGLLIHCISGWDRTPLFVSLLRISLWADGEIHQSLSAAELLYLTLTYDWILFGHSLSDRVQKGEEIMLFCFDFLKFITADKFSFGHMTHPGTKPCAHGQQHSLLVQASDSTAATFAARIVHTAVTEVAQQTDKVGVPFQLAKADPAHAALPADSPELPLTPAKAGSSRPIDIVRQQMVRGSGDDSPESFGSWNLLSTSRLTDDTLDGSFVETEVSMSAHHLSGHQPTLPPDDGAGSAVGADVFDGTHELLLDMDEPTAAAVDFDDDLDDDDAALYGAATSEYASSEDSGDKSTVDEDSGRDTGSTSTSSQDGSCVCDKCAAHAAGVGADESGTETRAARLHKLRDLFIPMYRRCNPDLDEGTSWKWMVEMTRLLPGTS